MNLQQTLSEEIALAATDTVGQADRRFRNACEKPVTFRAANDYGNARGIIIQACASGDPSAFQEMAVSLHTPDGACVADILIGLSPNGEVRVLTSVNGNGEGDKHVAVFPERPADKAVEEYN